MIILHNTALGTSIYKVLWDTYNFMETSIKEKPNKNIQDKATCALNVVCYQNHYFF